MATIYISLGTNMGDRLQNLERAAVLLEKAGFMIVKKSKVHETEEWVEPSAKPVIKNANYLNQCMELEAQMSPTTVFEKLRAIEREMGRDRMSEAYYKKMHGVQYAPRIIDLDILLYDDWFVREARALQNPDGTFEELIIPHPRMHEREFILNLLVEIAPNVIHPILQKTTQELTC